MTLSTMLVYLLLAHLLADYALQGDFMAKAKNRYQPVPGVPALTVLLSHSAIHAGFVLALTQSWWCAAVELIAHAIIDDVKCRGKISFNADQLLHIGFKVVYVAAMLAAQGGSDG